MRDKILLIFGAIAGILYFLWTGERKSRKITEEKLKSANMKDTQDDMARKVNDSIGTPIKPDLKADISKKIVKGGKWILFIFMMSCATKTEYIKPDIPRLVVYPRADLFEYETSPTDHCYMNEVILKSMVKTYERDIAIYLEFYESWYKK